MVLVSLLSSAFGCRFSPCPFSHLVVLLKTLHNPVVYNPIDIPTEFNVPTPFTSVLHEHHAGFEGLVAILVNVPGLGDRTLGRMNKGEGTRGGFGEESCCFLWFTHF